VITFTSKYENLNDLTNGAWISGSVYTPNPALSGNLRFHHDCPGLSERIAEFVSTGEHIKVELGLNVDNTWELWAKFTGAYEQASIGPEAGRYYADFTIVLAEERSPKTHHKSRYDHLNFSDSTGRDYFVEETDDESF